MKNLSISQNLFQKTGPAYLGSQFRVRYLAKMNKSKIRSQLKTHYSAQGSKTGRNKNTVF
jgi:hypothetical protein